MNEEILYYLNLYKPSKLAPSAIWILYKSIATFDIINAMKINR